MVLREYTVRRVVWAFCRVGRFLDCRHYQETNLGVFMFYGQVKGGSRNNTDFVRGYRDISWLWWAGL